MKDQAEILRQWVRPCLLVVFAALCIALIPVPRADADIGEVVTYPLPEAQSDPSGIATGADGNLWFTEARGRKIGRITPAGQITEFPLSGAGSPQGIVAGPDGALWFTGAAKGIGRITTAGEITEFPTPTPTGGAIIALTDGNLWFAGGGGIERMNLGGELKLFPVSAQGIAGLTYGPEGSLWFTAPGLIGRLTPSGSVTEFPVSGQFFLPGGITTGADGNLWFTEGHAWKIGRITPSGEISEFSLQGEIAPRAILTGPEGNLWYAASGGSHPAGGVIGRITSLEAPNLGYIGAGEGIPNSLTVGPERNLWFTANDDEYFRAGALVGRITPGVLEVEFAESLAKVHRGRTKLKLTCLASAPSASCRGSLSMLFRLPKPKKGLRRNMTLASRNFAIAAGETRSLSVRLTSAGRRVLHRLHHLTAHTTATVEGGQESAGEVGLSQRIVKSRK